jgi:hypothetical protein
LLLDGDGLFSEPTIFDRVILNSFAGAVAGATLMFSTGFLKHSVDAFRAAKRQRSVIATLYPAARSPGVLNSLREIRL